MAAGVTPIDMPAQRRGATARDRPKDRSLLRAQPRMLLDEGVALRVEDIGHLHGRPAHDGAASAAAATAQDHGRRHVQLLKRNGRRLKVPSGQVEIHRRVRQVGVAQEELNRPQVGPASSRWVAYECRSVCGVTRLSIPAFRAARRTASQITFVVIGASARQPLRVPGKR